MARWSRGPRLSLAELGGAKHLAEAVESCELALRYAPRHADAMHNLGVALERWCVTQIQPQHPPHWPTRANRLNRPSACQARGQGHGGSERRAAGRGGGAVHRIGQFPRTCRWLVSSVYRMHTRILCATLCVLRACGITGAAGVHGIRILMMPTGTT